MKDVKRVVAELKEVSRDQSINISIAIVKLKNKTRNALAA